MGVILIVEDEAMISSFIAKGLRHSGYEPLTAATGLDAVKAIEENQVDLVVLDLGLPDIDGFEVLRRIRARDAHLPVIILSARTSVNDTVAGLEGGANDYMAKPFSFEELVARVKLRLRPDAHDDLTLTHNDLSLDVRTRTATVDGRSVPLTAREFSLAEAFLRNPEQVLTREQLLSDVWGFDFDPGSNVVEVYMRYLRRKIGAKYFVTVRGMGYRLAP